ncbi:MAG: DUF5808 domain-containing protein [Gammaproteobacteria bacterium]|nr:DUF5808 domain-containing protein [Gammaproteobacteria bacterium]
MAEGQKKLNQNEWKNPANWGGPIWFSIYFSKKDSRTWVPKRVPWTGFTLNLARSNAVYWLMFIMMAISVVPVTLVVLFSHTPI